MIKAVLDLFRQPLPQSTPGHRIELATAVLMCEVIRADHQSQPEELAVLKDMLLNRFSLSDHEVKVLMEEGRETAEEAVDLVQFTKVINQQCSEEEKVEILTGLWQIANADNEVVPLEEHIIRRIADLLYMSHSQYIKTKLEVTGH